MAEPTPQRVKVYRLNEEGLWDDKGTGHVTVEVVEVRSRRGRARPRFGGAPCLPRTPCQCRNRLC